MSAPEVSSTSTTIEGSLLGELQRRERELTDFIEHALIPMHWVSGDGTILWANNAELRLLGYNSDEYIGHNIRGFHVDDQAIVEILQRLKNFETLEGVEARLRCKDGSVRYVAISSSVYTENDKFVHTRCVTVDTTAQRTATELQAQLAAIVESSDDAIISKDLNGIIRSWNKGAERLFGYTSEEMIGQPIAMIAVPERVDEIPDILARISRGERIDHYVTKRRAKDGRILTVSLSVSPIRNASGKVIGAAKVGRDITEREQHAQAIREINEGLRQANADLQQFAYSASHDLQEPLRMVATYSELLQREFGEILGETGEEYLRYTLQGANRMEQLLRDLRAYTLASTSQQEATEDIDAELVLDKALSDLATAVEESGTTVIREPLPTVRILGFQLEQLFQNLVGNAIRYRSGRPPHIRIAAQRDGNAWRFSVSDNGIGINPQYKEQIFDLFKRLHSVADYPGTGMGLAICKRIVERAGGRIWVESAQGHGSAFYFTIPARE